MESTGSALRAQLGDETLKERLASAVLVVTGKVLETRPLKRTTRFSEHEPDWAEAIIAVEKVEKGAFRGAKVTVYFPRSNDERWLLSPKFRAGQQWFASFPQGPNGLILSKSVLKTPSQAQGLGLESLCACHRHLW